MKKILIADDSFYQRKMLGSLVSSLGYESHLVSSGEALLEKVDSSFDCIFLDLLMTGISGIEVLKKLKERENIPPIIVITADIQEVRRNECLELGAVAFISKILSEEEIKKILNELFN
ncbi:MAG: response regulator [Cytophagales bacterium]|nr:response regulator [Cytophagales bacterium]